MTGRFVWYELMTPDTKGAIEFYSHVIGWKTQPFEESPPDKPYSMWVGSQGPLGGVMKLPGEAKGVPANWMAHVEVDDVDATVAKAKEKGARVHQPPTDIPTVGRFAVIADPQGASLSVFKPSERMQPHDKTKHGEFSWSELYTSDLAAGARFYNELFGWQQQSEMDMGEMGKYVIFGQAETRYGGMMKIPPGRDMPPAWTYYVHVDDLDAAIERAKSRDAKVMFGPMEVPDGSRVAMLTDPQGAVFALHADGTKS